MDDSREDITTDNLCKESDSRSSASTIGSAVKSECSTTEIKQEHDVPGDGLSTLSDCAKQSPHSTDANETDCTEHQGITCASEKTEGGDSPAEDSELNCLLDSAYEDFQKQEVSNTPLRDTGQVPTPQVSAAQVPSKDSTNKDALEALQFLAPSNDAQNKDPFNELFTEQASDEMAKAFEEAMKGLLSEDPSMMEQLEKLTQTAGEPMETPEAQREFSDTLSQTLAGLAKNVEDMEKMPEDDMMKIFANMNMGDNAEAGANAEFMPMMHGMMKTLMSKEVLYPSLKEMAAKYPQWLTENKEKIDQAEYNKYKSQENIVRKICTHFEHEDQNDTEDGKQKRFEDLMQLMQEMQELGQPPKEIVGEMAPGLEFDENGLPKMPGIGSGQCILM